MFYTGVHAPSWTLVLGRLTRVLRPLMLWCGKVILAGMNNVAHAELVAAVSNAGGLGVIGGA